MNRRQVTDRFPEGGGWALLRHVPAATPDIHDLELTLPARAENVGVIRHVLGAVADTLHVGDEQLDDMRLAVTEACANVVTHAYVSGTGLMDVWMHAHPAELEISVRDHGSGMAPRADSPGLGVGLPLMASLTTSMELLAPEGGGTEVRMRFPLTDEAAGVPIPQVVARRHERHR